MWFGSTQQLRIDKGSVSNVAQWTAKWLENKSDDCNGKDILSKAGLFGNPGTNMFLIMSQSILQKPLTDSCLLGRRSSLTLSRTITLIQMPQLTQPRLVKDGDQLWQEAVKSTTMLRSLR